MYKTLRFLSLLMLFCANYVLLIAQHDSIHISTTLVSEEVPKYDRSLHLSPGFTSFLFRDFATSPLFYNGIGLRAAVGYEIKSDKSEHFMDIDYIIGVAFAANPLPATASNSTLAMMNTSNLYYHFLHKLTTFYNNKYKISLGGSFMNSFNVRLNPALNNNSVGIENFSNFMFSFKLNRDISRHQIIIEDLFLFKRKLMPAKRSLSFQCNIGLLNFNYRPGYAYNYLGEMDGSSTNPLIYAIENHQWSMNGIRLNTKLEFSYFKPYKNGSKWAYVWDFANVPGKFESYQSAFHRIEYVLIINRNKQ
ncbi:MAG: hypothetical protein RBS19_02885 [Bacteroidales bacterium]|nr:hypothetical protein [Bacteroidales bacterium]MDY0215881.1 hypothetical protein [Bacteroidales bacterium]